MTSSVKPHSVAHSAQPASPRHLLTETAVGYRLMP